MKKLMPIPFLLIVLIILLSFIFNKKTKNDVSQTRAEERIAYEDLINNHKFRKRKYTSSQLSEIPKKDRPDLAWEQNYLATMNPVTGRPETEKLMDVRRIIKQQQEELLERNPGDGANPWVERGPDNVGGRTRALAWDPTSANKVWAGGVTGGLWYNNDITDANSSWQSVNDFWDNIAVTAVKFDPNDANTIYVGTGEGWGAGASRGEGVWKSTNGGTSFTQLVSTNSWRYVNDLVIRDEAGTSVVYVAISSQFYQGAWAGDDGLMRSTNGGTTWNQVLPNAAGGGTEHPTDLDIAADNDLWVGVGVNSFGNGGGSIYVSSNGTTFTLKHTNANPGRVNLACAPSDANYVYAAFEAGNQMDAFKQTTNDGTSWTTKSEPNDDDGGISAADFTRGQAWYDLTLDVDPLNANTVLMGGIDVFKTTNGGTGWTQLTHWYGGFGHQYLHADQQATVYKDGSSNDVIFGNDGGIGYSANGGTTISTRNKGYNVTQYYACAIHPSVGSNNFLAGAQDGSVLNPLFKLLWHQKIFPV